MRKEVVVTHEIVVCDVCGRTILKGERTEPYLVPDGDRRMVCELCTRRAEGAGWIRESTHADMPTAPAGTEARPSLLERFRTRWRENGPGARVRTTDPSGDGTAAAPGAERWPEREPDEGIAEPATYRSARRPAASEIEESAPPEIPESSFPDEPPGAPVGARAGDEPVDLTADEALVDPSLEAIDEDGSIRRRERRQGLRRRDPRQVRAVPTNAEAKVERALELFNDSDYSRTVGGLVRTLGEPWVAAFPVPESPSEVSVVVAWELSWYHYRVDLGDADPVALTGKGKEMSELNEDQRQWNAVSDPDGVLALGVPRES